MSDTIGRVHDWVLATLKSKGWSARKWAIDSKVAPSTLQRFKNPGVYRKLLLLS